MRPNDVILLLEKYTRRPFIVDLKDTDIASEFMTERTTTDKVHHITEMSCTTDACLDSMTVKPNDPIDNTVIVLPGKVQWFKEIIVFEDQEQSPDIPSFTTKDCDPAITDPVRWSLLCVKKDTLGKVVLFWSHGHPGGGYPYIPHEGVPLALVQTVPGIVKIKQEHIINWRSIRPGYTDGAYYQYPPVKDIEGLDKYADPPEGAQAFVLDQGKAFYFMNGAWRAAGMPSFDNTAFYVDIESHTPRVNLPWPVKTPVELNVFRDGQLMLLDKDYRVMVGQAPYLMFTYTIVPGQRIVVMRNPFLAQAYSPETQLNAIQVHNIYVDGETGVDTWDGSELNPFKTLQRAFDSIPIFSNHIYRVRAKNLKLADKVESDDQRARCFGWMRGKQMLTLEILIEDNYEWDPQELDYVYYLTNVNFIMYSGQKIGYRFMLVNCASGFLNTDFKDAVDIYGGNSSFIKCRGIQETNVPVTITTSCSAEIHDSAFNFFRIANAAYVRAYSTRFRNIVGWQGGLLQMFRGEIVDTVVYENSILDMTNTEIRAKGQFDNSYVAARNLIQDGKKGDRLKRFFWGRMTSVFVLENVQINYINDDAIRMEHGCTLWIKDSKITQAAFNGISLRHNSTAYVQGTDISSCSLSGTRGEYGSFFEFYKSKGNANSRYGCECFNLSRAEFRETLIHGWLGQYYELIPGADTVLTDREDILPGTLDEKIIPGPGLRKRKLPGSIPGDKKFHVELDFDALTGAGADSLLSLEPKQTVFQRNTPIPTPPDSQSVTTIPIRWPGQGYVSSVLQRVFNPAIQDKIVLLNKAEEDQFSQMDNIIGTQFVDDGLTLMNRPSLGYPVNRPYFVLTKPDGIGAISSFGISALNNFTLEADVPVGTTLQVAFSVNGSALWMKWNPDDVEWQQLIGDSTLIQMQNAPHHTEIPLWGQLCWDRLRQLGGSVITVCFLLTSTSTVLTPKVKSFTWNYVEDGFLLDVTEHFDRSYYSSRAVFSYRGTKGPLDPPIIFSVIPTNNRLK